MPAALLRRAVTRCTYAVNPASRVQRFNAGQHLHGNVCSGAPRHTLSRLQLANLSDVGAYQLHGLQQCQER